MGEIATGQGPFSLIPVNIGTVHIHGNPVDAEIVHIHGSPVDIGTIHVHGGMQTGVQIPQKGDGPVMPPWML